MSGVDASGNRLSFHVTILLGDEGTRSKVLILVRAVSCVGDASTGATPLDMRCEATQVA
jgi:hypothetical protein